MGMYTQAHGTLNVCSINGWGDRLIQEREKFENMKQEYLSLDKSERCHWVVDDTELITGGNGTIFIVFATELKNYERDIQQWIEFIAKKYPKAEGIINFQYEENEKSTLFVVKSGLVETFDGFWFEGYGNDC